MTDLQNKTVANLVAENIKTAHVFKKHGIDFCCGGGLAIAKACQKKGLDFALLEQELLAVDQPVQRAEDYNSWELDFLANYIVNVHHSYVREAIPLIIQYSTKVAKVHGGHYKEVPKVHDLFQEVADELLSHLRKEEALLFPYIVKLAEAKRTGALTARPAFGTAGNPIRIMMMEHESAGDSFKTIAVLTDNYTPPQGACNTFRALYAKLEEFERDLHRHIHLENNILFPKAMKLEQELLA